MKIDYKLKILGEKEEFEPRKEFIAPIEKSESKVFQIFADNGFGKTFLLNLIGYACFSDKLEDKFILKSLKESISRYGDEDSYDLSYKLVLDLPDGKTLTLKKDSNKKRCYEIDGETHYDHNRLHESIAVLYDVPTDPSERLNAVIKDIGIWNPNLEKKLTHYWEYLRSVQSDFLNVKDEAKIKNYKDNISHLENDIGGKTVSLNQTSDSIGQLIICQDLNDLLREYSRKGRIESELFKLEKRFKKLSKPKKIQKADEAIIINIQKDKERVRIEVNGILLTFISLIDETPELSKLISASKSSADSLMITRGVNVDELLDSDSYKEDLDVLMNSISQLEEEVSLFVRKEEMGKKYVAYNFLKNLLDQIDNLVESEAEGVLEEITKINSNTLIDEIKKNLSLNEVPDYSELKIFFKERLPKIKSLLAELWRLNGSLIKNSNKKGIDDEGELYYRLKGEKAVYLEKLNERTKAIDVLCHSISKSLSIDISLLSNSEGSRRIL